MKGNRPVYLVRAERDGSLWFAKVDGVAGAYTQARRLDLLEPMVRDMLALVLEVPSDSFDVAIDLGLDELTQKILVDSHAYRAIADFFGFAGSSMTREAVGRLSRKGLTVRDIGRIVGVSHQRAAQLLASEPSVPELPGPAVLTRVPVLIRQFLESGGEPDGDRLDRLARPPLEILEREVTIPI